MVLRCPVTQEERNLIEDKMKQLHATKIGAYLRKMGIDGYVIYRDDTEIKNINKQLQAIGRNINQIARKLNSTGNIYKDDVAELKERLDDIWQLQRTILLTLR